MLHVYSLGMSHDYDVGCAAPNDGIMGFKKYGWSTCSAYNLNFFIGYDEPFSVIELEWF